MRAAYHARRVQAVAPALGLARELARRERWSREQLEEHQRSRLDEIVRHAIAHSAFHRDRLAPYVGDGPVELERLPVLEKDEMMAAYDTLVTDPRLRRDELLRWLETLERDDIYLGRYRAMTTSGSSGRKGLFVYDRAGWAAILAQFVRFNEIAGIAPRLPRRTRIAALMGPSPTSMSRQVSVGLNIGVHRVLTLPVTAPIDELVAALNAFQPDALGGFASMIAALAEEQLAGRLRITPAMLTTSSEIQTPPMTERLIEAFGIHPHNAYATTEGAWGFDCARHDGIHLREDMTLVENVDAGNRPVPPGTPGARLLVTNLTNRVQPVIRLAVSDAVTVDPEPCPCGRPLMRVRSVEGRTDDILALPAAAGGEITVHPIQFAVIARDRDVREFQVVREATGLRVLVVAAPRAEAETERRIQTAVERRLTELGAAEPAVSVERRDRLPRTPGGKLQIVVDATATPSGGPSRSAVRI